jgi:hypothetical protein
VTEVDSRVAADRSPLELEFEGQVAALLARVTAQERLARAAQAESKHSYRWPSWSLDTGLTAAEETFVEAWSPQRVLDAARSVRQLVLVLQHWIQTHRDDTDLDGALAILATLPRL